MSYYPAIESSQLRSSQMKPKRQIHQISHFTPIGNQPNVGSVSKSLTGNRHRSSSVQPTAQKGTTDSKKNGMLPPSIVQDQDRPKEREKRNPLVPHLYADQRIRSRSTSREPPKTLPKEKKKVVAFGLTTPVEDNIMNASTTRLIKHHTETVRLRTEIEELRLKVAANEKVHKELDDLKALVNSMIPATKQSESLTRENKTLREELDKVKQDFTKEVQQNLKLKKRVEELASEFEKFSSSDKSTKSSGIVSIERPAELVPRNVVKNPLPLTTTSSSKDDLFSRMSPSANQKIRHMDRQLPVRLPNKSFTSYKDMDSTSQIQLSEVRGTPRDSSRHRRDFESSPYDNKRSPSKPSRPKSKEKFKTTRKALASNQVIDLIETTNAINDFNFCI